MEHHSRSDMKIPAMHAILFSPAHTQAPLIPLRNSFHSYIKGHLSFKGVLCTEKNVDLLSPFIRKWQAHHASAAHRFIQVHLSKRVFKTESTASSFSHPSIVLVVVIIVVKSGDMVKTGWCLSWKVHSHRTRSHFSCAKEKKKRLAL